MKSRYWSGILYPDSLPSNWKELIEEMQLPCAISPLHDKDIDIGTGKLKKPHYHILISFEGPRSQKQVEEIIKDTLNGAKPQRIISLRGYFRYLCHLDNPEKAQYNIEDIIQLCGFEIDLTTSEVNLIKSQICIDIEKEEITEYRDLVNLYLEQGDLQRFEIVSTHTMFFDKYITSKRHKKKVL